MLAALRPLCVCAQEKGGGAPLIPFSGALEAKLFGELVVSEVSARLVELFEATTALKKDTGTDGAVDDVAATGFFTRVHTGVLNSGGTASAQGFLFGGTNPLIRCSQTFCDDEKSKNSILSPAVAT
jgi:hypothetical protein